MQLLRIESILLYNLDIPLNKQLTERVHIELGRCPVPVTNFEHLKAENL